MNPLLHWAASILKSATTRAFAFRSILTTKPATWLAASMLMSLTGAAHAAALESGEALITDVVHKARAARKASNTYEFTRTKLATFYKSEKEIASEEKKVYRTSYVDGRFRTKLISINDHTPPPRPPKPEAKDADTKAAPRAVKSERNASSDSMLSQISDSAVHRFDYAIVGREAIEGRTAIVVEVKPKKGLKAVSIEEEVMSQLGGRVWVDEKDHEVVKTDIALKDTVKIGWGGVLGALREFRLSVVRTHIDSGEWVNTSSEVWLHFRQLFTSKRIRMRETVTEVNPVRTNDPR